MINEWEQMRNAIKEERKQQERETDKRMTGNKKNMQKRIKKKIKERENEKCLTVNKKNAIKKEERKQQ